MLGIGQCRDVDNSWKAGKISGCQSDFPGWKSTYHLWKAATLVKINRLLHLHFRLWQILSTSLQWQESYRSGPISWCLLQGLNCMCFLHFLLPWNSRRRLSLWCCWGDCWEWEWPNHLQTLLVILAYLSNWFFVQGTKKFNFPACLNFLKKSFPQNFHLPFGQVEGKIH